MKLIVCVCRGNIARSPVAENIINAELKARGLGNKYRCLSRGVQGTRVDPEPVKFPNITYYEKLHDDSRPTLEKFGIDLSFHISTPIDKETAEEADIILVMDGKTKQALQILFPNQVQKVHFLSELVDKESDITDPEGVSGREKQAKIFTEIREIILQGFPKLLALT